MRTLLFWLLAGAVLAVAHTIQPLSASNHTTYLLHGLADAGVGYLSEDWLAQTPDMSPAFSVLVRGLHWIAGPYGIRAGFVGVVAAYVWALFRIGAPGAGAIPGRASEWLVLGALVVMHAKLFDDALPREFGGEWARFFSWGFAGQYLLNRMFQPCLFGAALLVGVVLIRRGRVKLGLASAVFASWMHPTYVLSAAALTLAVILEDIRQGRYRRGAVHGLVALVLVAPVLIYVQSTFAGADPELVARAQSLLVHDRIPHHADPRSWFGPRMGLKLVLVVAVLYATRGTSFGRLLTVPTIVAVVGIVVVLLVHSDFLALLFPSGAIDDSRRRPREPEFVARTGHRARGRHRLPRIRSRAHGPHACTIEARAEGNGLGPGAGRGDLRTNVVDSPRLEGIPPRHWTPGVGRLEVPSLRCSGDHRMESQSRHLTGA
jgi:hypothetical protein